MSTVVPDPEADKHPKAGRNLPAAIAVGVGIGVLALLCLFTVKWLFVALAVAAICAGVYELTGAFAQHGIRLARTPLYLGAVIIAVAAYVGGTTWHLAAFGALIISILIWRIRRGTEGYVNDTAASVFTAAYLPFMVGFAMLMLAADNGPQRIVAFVALTVCNDVGGYFSGVMLGKHPIAPKVSPKKSWEGFAGSVLLASLVGALLFHFMFDAAWWKGIVLAVVMCITATAGDFTESAIKRDLGVKDMGTVLPGHGGIMDRLDSLIPNAFVAWALLTLLLGVGTRTLV